MTVPRQLNVANGGTRILDTVDGELRTVVYESSRPSDVLMFAIGPYEMVRAKEVRFYHFPEDAFGARRLQARTLEALDLFGRWFGPLDKSTEGLAFIEIPDGFGSQAVAPTIIQSAAAFRDPAKIFEIYHEIAHLWNVRDLDEPSPRWNEGLSTFLQHLVEEKIDGNDAYVRGMARVFSLAKQRLSGETACVSLSDFGHRKIASRQSYIAGGLFFARFHYLYGEKLLDAYGSFFQKHQETGASTEEFLKGLAEDLGPTAVNEIDDWFRSCRYLEKIQAADSFEAFLP